MIWWISQGFSHPWCRISSINSRFDLRLFYVSPLLGGIPSARVSNGPEPTRWTSSIVAWSINSPTAICQKKILAILLVTFFGWLSDFFWMFEWPPTRDKKRSLWITSMLIKNQADIVDASRIRRSRLIMVNVTLFTMFYMSRRVCKMSSINSTETLGWKVKGIASPVIVLMHTWVTIL